MYLSENIWHFCCILCCMEDWWWTSTSLIEYWSNTWLSCYVCLQNGATLCDACGCSDGLLGLLVNTEVRTMELGDCLLASHFKVLFKGQGIDITSLLSPASWKCPLMSFVCPFFILVCSKSVCEYYGNGRQAWRERSTGQECSSHSFWAQTPVMRLMELFTHSVFFV